MSLVTLANYKAYLKITDTAQDTNLGVIQNAVEKRVKEFLHRDLESTTYASEIFDGNGLNTLPLRQVPVTAVTTIQYYEGLDSTNTETWTTLALGTDYERKIIPTAADCVILDGYTFVLGLQNYKITYTAGYSTIPYDIEMACKELLKIVYDNSPINQNRLGFLTISDSNGGASNGLSLDPDIEMKILKKIQHYKAFNV